MENCGFKIEGGLINRMLEINKGSDVVGFELHKTVKKTLIGVGTSYKTVNTVLINLPCDVNSKELFTTKQKMLALVQRYKIGRGG